MKKYLKIIIILLISIVLLLSIILYIKLSHQTITFSLFGDLEYTMYENENYEEAGFIAVNNNGENLKNKVKIKSNLKVNKPGTYTIKYSVRDGLKKYKRERTVKVLKDELPNVYFKLKGSNVLNMQKGKEYVDLGYKASTKDDKKDLTNNVRIINSINTNKAGEYEVKYLLVYDGKIKTLTRKVYVLEQTNSYSLSTTNPTNKNIELKLRSYIYNFGYIVCPNGKIVYTNTLNYTIFENGTYKFTVYDLNNNKEEVVIKVNNIDRIPPKGTCSSTVGKSSSIFNVSSEDNDIDYLLYNSKKEYKSKEYKFNLNKSLRNTNVLLVDKAGNKTTVKCNEKHIYESVLKLTKNVKYKEETNSLKYYMSYNKNGYYITRIWMKDPYTQIKKQMLEESDKDLKLPKKLLETAIEENNLQNKLIIANDASGTVKKGVYYVDLVKSYPQYNLKEPGSLLLYKGKVIFNYYSTYPSTNPIYYINSSNELSFIKNLENKTKDERKQIFQSVISDGVKDTFAFSPVLVQNKKANTVKNDYNALRQGLCQVNENNFILVTSATKHWSRQNFANLLESLGCKTAINLDGGGSTSLYIKSKKSTNVKTIVGNTRALSSVMYFTELD